MEPTPSLTLGCDSSLRHLVLASLWPLRQLLRELLLVSPGSDLLAHVALGCAEHFGVKCWCPIVRNIQTSQTTASINASLRDRTCKDRAKSNAFWNSLNVCSCLDMIVVVGLCRHVSLSALSNDPCCDGVGVP